MIRLNPDIPPYWIEDVVRVFRGTFSARRMLTDDWIVHGRYLLTIAEDEHVETLFLAGHGELFPEWRYPKLGLSTSAAWMAGLLQFDRFIETIGQLCLPPEDWFRGAGEARWALCIRFASLLLFGDSNVSEFFKQATEKSGNDEIGKIAQYCIDLMNRGGDSIDCDENDDIPRHEFVMNKILQFSHVLRAGMSPEHTQEFPRKLTRLLHDTIAPAQFIRGLPPGNQAQEISFLLAQTIDFSDTKHY